MFRINTIHVYTVISSKSSHYQYIQIADRGPSALALFYGGSSASTVVLLLLLGVVGERVPKTPADNLLGIFNSLANFQAQER